MQGLNEWFGVLWDLLVDSKEDACFELICHTRPAARTAGVDLIEGRLMPDEAVNYARILLELGREVCAEEVLRAVAFGGVASSQYSATAAAPTLATREAAHA
jgi:hypothetical protein